MSVIEHGAYIFTNQSYFCGFLFLFLLQLELREEGAILSQLQLTNEMTKMKDKVNNSDQMKDT